MRRRKRKSYKLKIMIIICIVLVLGIFASKISFFQIIISHTKNLGFNIIELINKPVYLLEDFVNKTDEKNKMYEKYKKMEVELYNYEETKNKISELEKENNNLKELLKIEKNEKYDLLTVKTINRKVGYWNDLITINKGKKDGVELGQPIVTNKGLVGTTTQVSNSFSKVSLITNKKNSFMSIKINNNNNDYIYGTIIDYQDNLFIVELFENKPIALNSLVTTTGLTDKYPGGIIIGEVIKEELDSFGLTRKIFVKSNVDFNDLNYLSVVLVK